MDEEGTVMLPVKNAKWFDEMSMGGHITNYDSMLVLTHFKGHMMCGLWSIAEEELMERMTESSKAWKMISIS